MCLGGSDIGPSKEASTETAGAVVRYELLNAGQDSLSKKMLWNSNEALSHAKLQVQAMQVLWSIRKSGTNSKCFQSSSDYFYFWMCIGVCPEIYTQQIGRT